MNILILGGTGVMGTMLVKQLASNKSNIITVTSRSDRNSDNSRIIYIKGNGKNLEFLKTLLKTRYDVIIDFIYCGTAEFKEKYELLLNNTDQYVYISSARVFAKSDIPITENTPRLLDSLKDDLEYLNTDEYALAKARCEDLLINSGRKNYTIIRPSITYGPERLQLGVLEKEAWLYRAMHGRSIVFSKDIGPKYTAMTTGEDVAKGITAIIGNQEAFGESFNITYEKSYTWDEILNCYMKVLQENGFKVNTIYTDKAISLKINKYQVIYCRYFNRKFDNSKIRNYINVSNFESPMDGLKRCLNEFLKNPHFKEINWKLEAWNDRASKEHTPLNEIPSLKYKIVYLLYRYKLDLFADAIRLIYQKLKKDYY